MDQSINLFTQSWAAAPPPALFSNLSLAPIPLLFPLVGDKCLTEAIRVARALTDMWQCDTRPDADGSPHHTNPPCLQCCH